MGEVNVIINNQKIVAEAGETILDAARRANIRIPTLCYLKDVNAGLRGNGRLDQLRACNPRTQNHG